MLRVELVWGQGLGLCLWVSVHKVGAGVSLFLGVGPSVPMNACSNTCCAASVWVSMFMACGEMRGLCAAAFAPNMRHRNGC